MNGKLAIALILVLSCSPALGQMSLDSSEFPIVGTNYALINVAFPNIPPSSAPGPNQTYDFTGGFTYGGNLINYTDATLGPFAAQYGTSTLARYVPGDINDGVHDQHLMYTVDASGFWQNGMVWIGYLLDTLTIDTLYFYFNPPDEDTLLTNQYTYGYTDSTHAASILTVWFGPTKVDVTSKIYRLINVDGWGKVEMGNGVFDSVLRVNVVESKYDSTFVNGVLDNSSQNETEYNLYYKLGERHPLVKEFVDPIMVVDPDTIYYYVTEILNIPPPPVVVLGCTDTMAVNYSPMANQDDGSCVICAPIPYSITADTSVCTGESAVLSVSGGTSYQWSNGETSPSIVVNPSTTTLYSVLINSSQFCWEQATVEVTVHDNVIAEFWNGTPNNTGPTTFVNLSTDATDYFWDFGDGTTSIEENPIKYYSALGSYTVMLIASNSCSDDTMLVTLDVVIGVPDLVGKIKNLKVVPNPVQDAASVWFTLNNAGIIELDILDVLGRRSTVIGAQKLSSGHHKIDLSAQIENRKQGVYFIRVRSEGEQRYYKWIKQ